MGRLACKRGFGEKTLKLEKTKGCVGVKQGTIHVMLLPRENGTG